MLEETTIIKSKAIFSDDKEHRLLLRKEWNNEKLSAMVIMINPNTADTVNFDMTTMLVLNNVSKLGFGSVNIVNLYSRIMEKLNLRFNGDDELIDDEADDVIEQYAAMSDAIINCMGHDREEYSACQRTAEIPAGIDKAACQQDVPDWEECPPPTHAGSPKRMGVGTL